MTGPHGYAEHFSAPEGYLDFAGYGPPSRDVLDASARALAASATGEPEQDAGPRARAAAARLAGTDPDHIVLLPDTATGLFHAALGIPSGTVLVPAQELPWGRLPAPRAGGTHPWRRAAALGRAVPRWLAGPPTPEAVRAALTDDVVAVSVSAVDYRTGYRADLAALREVIGDRLLVVDAIQAFGAAAMDWQAADLVCSGGRTWLRAGWGTGFAAVSDRALDRLETALTGHPGAEDAPLGDPAEHPHTSGAARFGAADPGPVAAAALAAAFDVLERAGVPAVERHIGERVEQLIDTVRSGGGRVLSPAAHQDRAGIVAFTVPGVAPQDVGDALGRHGVTATVHPGSVRLSPHASTPLAAVDLVLAALSDLRRAAWAS